MLILIETGYYAKTILRKRIKPLVDQPNEVRITEIEGEVICIYELWVGAGDYGKIIGKRGQNANGIRTILSAVSSKGGKRGVLEILE